MSDKKDIGSFIAKKMETGNINAPNEALWSKISQSLEARKKRRRRIFLFWIMAASSIAILLALFWFYSGSIQMRSPSERLPDNPISTERILSDGDSNTSEESIPVPPNGFSSDVKNDEEDVNTDAKRPKKNLNEGNRKHSQNISASSLQKKSKMADAIDPRDTSKYNIESAQQSSKKLQKPDGLNKNKKKHSSEISGTDTSGKNTIGLVVKSETKTDSIDAIKKYNDSLSKKKPPKKISKSDRDSTSTIEKKGLLLSVEAVGGPVWFHVSKQSYMLDRMFTGMEKKENTTFSYGLLAELSLSQKISVSTGVLRTEHAYSIENVAVNSDASRVALSTLESVTRDQVVSADDIDRFRNQADALTLSHSIKYMETPLYFRYKFGDQTWGFNALGGFSVYFLATDDVYLENSLGETLRLGKATNISSIDISINMGGAAFYKPFENFTVEVSPIYRFHLQTIDNYNIDSSNFSLVLYGGIKYHF